MRGLRHPSRLHPLHGVPVNPSRTALLACLLLATTGCYDRNTRLVDAWYPGGPDAALVDAHVLPPDAFVGPDAFVPPDAFVGPDATFDAGPPGHAAISSGCARAPNMYAFASSTVDLAGTAVWDPIFRATNYFWVTDTSTDMFRFQSVPRFAVGAVPLGPIVAPPRGAVGFEAIVGSSRCTTTGGQLVIQELTFERLPSGSGERITRFRATFTQECGADVRRGCVSYTAP